MKLDILAIGVHPDDVELSCAGTILNEIARGKKVGIVDLTAGELGTRGSGEIRKKEAEQAAAIMGISIRENLGMADGFFENNEANKLKLITAIREYKPEIVLGNVLQDRHPDHGRAGQLIYDACFLAGLIKIETQNHLGATQEKWRPKYLFQYIQDDYHEPDFIVDISAHFSKKLEAIEAYSSQFYTKNDALNEPQTYISTQGFFDAIKARNLLMGKKIGTQYGEGFLSSKRIGLTNFDCLTLQET